MSDVDRDLEQVRQLAALHASGDLSHEETRAINEAARYDPASREAIASFAELVNRLREAGAEPLPVDERPSLWSKIETQLGPAVRRRRPSVLPWIGTSQLAAASMAFVAFAIYMETRPAGVGPARMVAAGPGVDLQAGAGADFERSMRVPEAPPRPVLGVLVESVDDLTRQRLGLDKNSGALIVRVTPGMPAAEAGIRQGDVVVSVNDVPVDSPTSLVEQVARRPAHAPIKVVLLREGKRIETMISAPDRNNARARVDAPAIVDLVWSTGRLTV